jgi:hypothetical protein
MILLGKDFPLTGPSVTVVMQESPFSQSHNGLVAPHLMASEKDTEY